MAFAVIALSAAAQNDVAKNDHVTLKAGLGWATCGMGYLLPKQ